MSKLIGVFANLIKLLETYIENNIVTQIYKIYEKIKNKFQIGIKENI